ncbi:4-hydroxythreonine-4-phosphate dehydrogenase PdxA [Candidatus Pelagibacter sp.]|nr:4-hydroxythreonine-4-phosphate dehydrogenase PdxA [Candidatus Pelagibacter sp.]
MNINHILVVITEPKSVFLEILIRYFKSSSFKKNKKKISIVGNISLIRREIKKNNYKIKINEILDISESKKNVINIINIKTKNKIKISSYISDCFDKSLYILKKNKNVALLNGPVNKKTFLRKKYLGITEYLAKKTKSKNPVMLIYNETLSVSPITTHLPIKYVSKNINKSKIIKKVKSINSFYVKNLKKKPKIAVLGLNPHCETIERAGEEQKEIIPAIRRLRSEKLNIKGPFSADTFFIKKNIDNYDVVVGMYHDQVLTPLKTLYNFNAINITIGLPFIRVSPDHGPNISMYGKNKSDPSSIFCAMDFFNKN